MAASQPCWLGPLMTQSTVGPKSCPAHNQSIKDIIAEQIGIRNKKKLLTTLSRVLLAIHGDTRSRPSELTSSATKGIICTEIARNRGCLRDSIVLSLIYNS